MCPKTSNWYKWKSCQFLFGWISATWLCLGKVWQWFLCNFEKKPFSKDLLEEVQDKRKSESGGRINRIDGSKDKCTEEVCGQIYQKFCRAALSENENSGIRKDLTEKIIESSVESCGWASCYGKIIGTVTWIWGANRWTPGWWFFIKQFGYRFADVEELDVNDARSETNFNSVAWNNVTAIASNWCQS